MWVNHELTQAFLIHAQLVVMHEPLAWNCACQQYEGEKDVKGEGAHGVDDVRGDGGQGRHGADSAPEEKDDEEAPDMMMPPKKEDLEVVTPKRKRWC